MLDSKEYISICKHVHYFDKKDKNKQCQQLENCLLSVVCIACITSGTGRSCKSNMYTRISESGKKTRLQHSVKLFDGKQIC